MTIKKNMLDGVEPLLMLDNEVVFIESIQEMKQKAITASVKMDWNAIVHCRRGRIMLELGGNHEVKVQAGQLLLIPAQKLMQAMMVSTDIDMGVLLMSDRVLKSALGPQIDIWNRAMYLQESYVIDTQRWTNMLEAQAQGIFKGEAPTLSNEITYAFLRIFLLIVCEELLHMERLEQESDSYNAIASTDHDKVLFKKFLELLHHERQKRQQVSYYANHLCITPKYLSTVCRRVSGKTPMRWITECVMEDSYQLLTNTNLTVKEISNRLGFPNASFFGQYFKEQAGMTPVDYRNKTRMTM